MKTPRSLNSSGAASDSLTVTTLLGDKWLFSARIPAAARRAAG